MEPAPIRWILISDLLAKTSQEFLDTDIATPTTHGSTMSQSVDFAAVS